MMVKPNPDPKPAGPVRRAARAAARQVNVRAAGRKVEEIFADELDTPPDNGTQQRADLARVDLPRFAGLADVVTAHMAGLAAAGILAATAVAAFAGVVDAGLDKVIPPTAPTNEAQAPVPPVRPTCDEPTSGCPQRGDAVEPWWSR